MMALARRPRLLAGLAAALLVALGAIGWMHTGAGLRFLAFLGVPCPADTVDVRQVDALRAHGLAAVRGSAAAPARPLPAGLRLDTTTEAEARALLARAHAQCDDRARGYRYLRCRGVDAGALALAGPPVSEVWLSFDGAGRLVGVDLYWRGMAPAELRTVWSGATRALRKTLGTPTLELGDPAPEALAAQAVQTARVQYRFADYMATVTAAHMPRAGLSVREQYLSARMYARL